MIYKLKSICKHMSVAEDIDLYLHWYLHWFPNKSLFNIFWQAKVWSKAYKIALVLVLYQLLNHTIEAYFCIKTKLVYHQQKCEQGNFVGEAIKTFRHINLVNLSCESIVKVFALISSAMFFWEYGCHLNMIIRKISYSFSPGKSKQKLQVYMGL